MIRTLEQGDPNRGLGEHRGQPGSFTLRRRLELTDLQLILYARHEFLGGKRLDQIVHSAGAQSLDARLLVSPGGKEEDRNAAGIVALLELPQQFEAVEPGHHHIAQDQFRRPVERRDHRFLAIAHRFDVPR